MLIFSLKTVLSRKGPLKFKHFSFRTNIYHKGRQRTANEYAEERRIYKDLISKNEK